MVLKQFQSITPVLVVKKVHFYKTHHMMRKTREGGVTREKVKQLGILVRFRAEDSNYESEHPPNIYITQAGLNEHTFKC